MQIGPLEASAPGPKRASAPFLPYVHAFRAVAIVGVVASHFDVNWANLTFGGRLLLSLARNASALFLFVAGFLFQYLSQNFSYGRYLKSKLQNVIAPYVLASLPELIRQYHAHAGLFAEDAPGPFTNPILRAGFALLTASHMPAPLWFIPMISVLYLAAPLLLAMDRRPSAYIVFFPLLGVAMLCHRPLPVNHIGQAVAYFLPAYVAGMWFSHHRARVMTFINDHLALLFFVWLAIELVDLFVLQHAGPLFSRVPFSTEQGTLDLNLPGKIMLSFCLVGLLARYQNTIGTRLDYLAGASFGVFFVHGYLIELVAAKSVRWWHQEFAPSPESVIVLVPLFTLASVAIVAGVRAVAGKRSRYIVGC
jgi:surface polysaccharide O-acyltransferase-like enzyme